jgi:hypothetical protein
MPTTRSARAVRDPRVPSDGAQPVKAALPPNYGRAATFARQQASLGLWHAVARPSIAAPKLAAAFAGENHVNAVGRAIALANHATVEMRGSTSRSWQVIAHILGGSQHELAWAGIGLLQQVSERLEPAGVRIVTRLKSVPGSSNL